MTHSTEAKKNKNESSSKRKYSSNDLSPSDPKKLVTIKKSDLD